MKGRKNKNRKKGRGLLLKAAIPLVLAAAVFMALRGYMRSNGMFPLKKIVFVGNRNLSSGELLALLNVKAGQNMLRMSKRDLTERLLASPWVEAAAVRKEILTGRIVARVDERKPFVIIRRDGVMWLADFQGRLLEPLRAGTVPFLPVIDADVRNYPDTFREAVLLARCLKKLGYFQRPIQIMAACPTEELSMQSGDEIIRVGFGDYGQKLNMLAELESEIAKRQIKASVVDLRFANRVIVTPVVAQVAKGAAPVKGQTMKGRAG
ncbi:MAG: FtsQ-type POTRA domain-containing protein [Nitrospiraceae bacterium]|nr:FtsQ-type POTRA domain-containing protein [Nitrospiraceae bacterium]